MKQIKLFAIISVLSLFPLVVGCSSKPSDREVEQAIMNEWSSGGAITTVTISEWGNFNKEKKYWPVKVRVVGTINVSNVPFDVDAVSIWHLSEDDFGVWQAEVQRYH